MDIKPLKNTYEDKYKSSNITHLIYAKDVKLL